jgi:hypothetical protein
MNRVDTQSHDRKYFLVTPQLVMDVCENPLQFTLWSVIRSIAGDTGECYLSTEDLATLAMMSTGSVSTQRTRLVELGLLAGELRRDPGYPQGVWHLRIPDLWVQNTEWAQRYPTLKARALRKKEQKESLQHVKPSGGEGQPSGGEGFSREEPSGAETNKNNQKNKRAASTSTKTAQPPAVSRPAQQLASSSKKKSKYPSLLTYAVSQGISEETAKAMVAGIVEIGGHTKIAELGTDTGIRAVDEAIEVVTNLIALGHRDTSRFDDLFNVWKNTHWTARPNAPGGQRQRPRYQHLTEVAMEIDNGELSWNNKEVFTPIALKHHHKLVYTFNAEGHYRDPDNPTHIYNKEGRFVTIDHAYVPESKTP